MIPSSLPLGNGLIILLLALGWWPGSAFAQGNSAPLLTTIINPTPADNGFFGDAVAAVGSDCVLVGAQDVGKAYLFTLNGTLLTTFTNPAPGLAGFGISVAAVGSDRVLIGTGYGGGPYLFATNGTLLTTFTNPAPATILEFGIFVAAVGSDRVVIVGLTDPNQPGPYPGSVCLFNTNGTLLTTFPNPAPADPGGYGVVAAAVGSDRLLMGAPYTSTSASLASGVPDDIGAAYLFNLNGTLLTTFTTPTRVAGGNFGYSVAAVGNDAMLISATGVGAGGTAYLFNTNGTLLTTIPNPSPAVADSFGYSLAAVGSSRVLIAAPQDGTGAYQAGSAYLFSTNGTLLTTITNPTPEVQDFFGYSVAAAGTDRVIIGGVWDNTGAAHAGAAYLFALPYPSLSIARNAATVSISWVTPETGLVLQETGLLGTPTVWSNTTNSVSINGLTNVIQQAPGAANRFFRLHRP